MYRHYRAFRPIFGPRVIASNQQDHFDKPPNRTMRYRGQHPSQISFEIGGSLIACGPDGGTSRGTACAIASSGIASSGLLTRTVHAASRCAHCLLRIGTS